MQYTVCEKFTKTNNSWNIQNDLHFSGLAWSSITYDSKVKLSSVDVIHILLN